MIDFRKLVEAGVHFGHKASRLHPKMAPYIWGLRDTIHLIDVSKTARELERAAQFLMSVAAEGKTIMWVGTKKAAQSGISATARELNCPYVTHRWIGGTLTNHSQVKKSVTKLLHLEDIIKKADQMRHTKKELVMMQKAIDRLTKNVGSIATMNWPIGVLVLVDLKKEATALREATHMGIPVVGLVDTNADPSLVDYAIPCNDDAPKSVNLILTYLAEAVKKGQVEAEKRKQELKAQKELEKKEAKKSAEESKTEDKPVKAEEAPDKKTVAKKKAKASKSTITGEKEEKDKKLTEQKTEKAPDKKADTKEASSKKLKTTATASEKSDAPKKKK